MAWLLAANVFTSVVKRERESEKIISRLLTVTGLDRPRGEERGEGGEEGGGGGEMRQAKVQRKLQKNTC